MKKTTKILLLTSIVSLLAISSAFAHERDWKVTPSAKALAAASAATYDQAYLDAVNSDAGADIIPSAKALAAAEHYEYDATRMALVGDDGAGSYYFASEHQSAEVNTIVNRAAEDSFNLYQLLSPISERFSRLFPWGRGGSL